MLQVWWYGAGEGGVLSVRGGAVGGVGAVVEGLWVRWAVGKWARWSDGGCGGRAREDGGEVSG